MDKRHLYIGLAAIGVIILLLSSGLIDLNLYRSETSASQGASMECLKPIGPYELNVQYNGKTLDSEAYLGNDQVLMISADIKKYKYHGWMPPFYKEFTMDYHCTVKNTNMKNNPAKKIKGQIDGTIHAKIIGFCSMRKAQEIAQDEALKSIKDYLHTSLLNNE